MYSWPKPSETTMAKMDAIDRFHSPTNKEHLSRFLTMIEADISEPSLSKTPAYSLSLSQICQQILQASLSNFTNAIYIIIP
jgi:hypothetical protein